ncbi:MAG: hypothetical protein JNL13_10145 [Chitinophagaceae bacterium]|nr:hypothetical protein [Chitinophagaceae bacterium]
MVLLTVQAGKETAAASGDRYALGLPERLQPHESAPEGFFEQHHPGYEGRVLAVHAKKKARFRAPDTSERSQGRFAELQSTTHFRLIMAVNSHYYKANFSSQQYCFLFRLTPF